MDNKRPRWLFQPDWEPLIVDIEPEKEEAAPRFVLGEAALAGSAPVQVTVWLGSLLKVPRPKKGWMSRLFQRGYFASEED
jgi:hypothetical protein